MTLESLLVFFIFCDPNDNFDVGVDSCVSYWFILVRPRVLCCWLSWPLTPVMQSDGRKLSYIMMVTLHYLHVECGHCTVKMMYENVLSNVVKVTNAL